jgi:hypothetical protein
MSESDFISLFVSGAAFLVSVTSLIISCVSLHFSMKAEKIDLKNGFDEKIGSLILVPLRDLESDMILLENDEINAAFTKTLIDNIALSNIIDARVFASDTERNVLFEYLNNLSDNNSYIKQLGDLIDDYFQFRDSIVLKGSVSPQDKKVIHTFIHKLRDLRVSSLKKMKTAFDEVKVI